MTVNFPNLVKEKDTKDKKALVAVLKSDKIDFKTKAIVRDKEEH